MLIDYPYWIYKYLIQEGSFYGFISEVTFWSFFAGKGRQVWYIALILMLYFCVPYFFKLLDGKTYKIILKITVLIFSLYLLYYILQFQSNINIQK